MKDEKQNDHITLACFLKQRYIAILRLEERWMTNLVNCSIESHKNKKQSRTSPYVQFKEFSLTKQKN